MLTLTSTEMEALTPSEQQCARMLGLDVNPWKRTRKSSIKCTSGESYILMTKVSCRLCNCSHTRIFQMTKQGSVLSSKEIFALPKEVKVKTSSYTVRCCRNCRNYLEYFNKEELIQKFLSYINDGRNFLTYRGIK